MVLEYHGLSKSGRTDLMCITNNTTSARYYQSIGHFYAQKRGVMSRKRKGELPSGNIRKLVYDHSEPLFDNNGFPVLDNKTGKQKKKRIYLSVTAQNSSQAQIAALKIKEKRSKVKYSPDMTVRFAIEEYIRLSDKSLSPTTLAGYDTILRYGFQNFLNVRLIDVDNFTLKEAVREESMRPVARRKDGKIISEKTLKNEYELITSALHQFDPTINTKAKLKSPARRLRDLPSPDEIFRAVKDTKIELPVVLAMWLSFTVSEMRGLTKSKSISHDGNYLSVMEVKVHVNRTDIVKEQAKNNKRNRRLRIPDYVKDLIERVETDEIVTMTNSVIDKAFSKCLKDANIPKITFHDLRHINASVMAILHVPDKYAQDRGGWNSNRVMNSVYQETFAPERVAVDDKVDDYFNSVVSLPEMNNVGQYQGWLALFKKVDSEESRKQFEVFCEQNKI